MMAPDNMDWSIEKLTSTYTTVEVRKSFPCPWDNTGTAYYTSVHDMRDGLVLGLGGGCDYDCQHGKVSCG